MAAWGWGRPAVAGLPWCKSHLGADIWPSSFLRCGQPGTSCASYRKISWKEKASDQDKVTAERCCKPSLHALLGPWAES